MGKIKIERQMDGMDCGPACLKMIASYYGRKYSLDTLRDYMYIGKEGVSLLNINNAAEKIGFRTIVGYFTEDQLYEKVPLPCILHWDQKHFVVLHKVAKRGNKRIWHVADPGKGLIKYSDDEFLNYWLSTKTNDVEKGVALVLEPSNSFYEVSNDHEEKPSKRVFLARYFIRYKKYFVQLLLGLLIGSLIQLIFPFLTQAVVDIGIGQKNINFIWLILLAQLFLLFGRSGIAFIRGRILLHISTRINISLISDFFVKLMKLSMSFFDTKLLGDLLQRIEDHNRIEEFITTQSLELIFSFFSVIVLGTVLFIYNIQIFFIFLIGSIIYGIWVVLFLKKRRILDYKMFEQQAINRGKTYQLINGMEEIKLQGCENRKRWEWEDTQADLFDIKLKSLSLNQTEEVGSIFISEIRNISITILAAYAVINGELTLGMMLSIQYIIGELNSPITQIMEFFYKWQDVSLSFERINEIHNKENEDNDYRDISEFDADKSIYLNDVTFQYEGPSSKKVLDDINLTIPQGKVTAIVGASGSGKTTLLKLLLGYYPPVNGEINIGQKPLEKMNLSWWRSKCGVVMQDGFIFSESIAQNIAASTEDIDPAKIKIAAQLANIDDYIDQLPLKYNTVVGQEGKGISQGQRQRFLIARSIYKDPAFLFFDEATNALDANNEKVITKNLEDFYKGRTVVVVAHRLSTVKTADQIVVLNDGKIVEIGNHEELTKKKGEYYELVKNQLELGN